MDDKGFTTKLPIWVSQFILAVTGEFRLSLLLIWTMATVSKSMPLLSRFLFIQPFFSPTQKDVSPHPPLSHKVMFAESIEVESKHEKQPSSCSHMSISLYARIQGARQVTWAGRAVVREGVNSDLRALPKRHSNSNLELTSKQNTINKSSGRPHLSLGQCAISGSSEAFLIYT